MGGVVAREVEGGLRHADGERADAGAEQVEGAHGDAEALPGGAEKVVARDGDPVEREVSQRVRGDHVERFAGEPGTVGGNEERGDAPCPGVRAGAGEHGVDVGVGSVGDPGLLTGEAPPARLRARPWFRFGGQAQRGGIGPGVRLTERERRDGVAGRDLRDPVGDLLLGSGLDDGGGAESLQCQCGLGRGADLRQCLAEQAQLDRRRRARRPPVGGPGKKGMEQPRAAETVQQVAVDPARVCGRPRREADRVSGVVEPPWP
ncbi:hypothetical protein NOGI109294_21600 [Nocardiopsis gilva]